MQRDPNRITAKRYLLHLKQRNIPIRSAWLHEQETTCKTIGQGIIHIVLVPEPPGLSEEMHGFFRVSGGRLILGLKFSSWDTPWRVPTGRTPTEPTPTERIPTERIPT